MYCAVSGSPTFNELIIVGSLSAIVLSIYDTLIYVYIKTLFIFFLCGRIIVELLEVESFIVFIR